MTVNSSPAMPTTNNQDEVAARPGEPLHREAIRINIVMGHFTRQSLVGTDMWPIRYTHREPKTMRDVKETLRAGPYAWPGGYPLYLITADSEPLCFDCALKNFREIWFAMNRDNCAPDWRIVACEINEEDFDLRCSHCEEPIEASVEPADEPEEKEEEEEDFIRAGGEVICEVCQLPYKQHPYSYKPADLFQGHPYLNVLCDGSKVKL